MEIEIKDLLEKIKSEGFAEAEKKKNEIINDAEKEAERIVKDAEKKKEALLEEGKKEVALLKEGAISDIRQAERDMIISFKSSIENIMKKLLNESVRDALDEKGLLELIKKVISLGYAEEKDRILVSPEDEALLLSTVLKKTGAELEKGIVLSSSSAINGGIRVVKKDNSSYIDMSDEEIARSLSALLSDRIREILS